MYTHMYAHIYSEDLLRAQNLLAETKVLLESVSKEPCISVKEPYISSQEHYVSAK